MKRFEGSLSRSRDNCPIEGPHRVHYLPREYGYQIVRYGYRTVRNEFVYKICYLASPTACVVSGGDYDAAVVEEEETEGEVEREVARAIEFLQMRGYVVAHR